MQKVVGEYQQARSNDSRDEGESFIDGHLCRTKQPHGTRISKRSLLSVDNTLAYCCEVTTIHTRTEATICLTSAISQHDAASGLRSDGQDRIFRERIVK